MPPDPPTPVPTEPPVFNCKGDDYAATVFRGSLILLQVTSIFFLNFYHRVLQARLNPSYIATSVPVQL